MTFRMPTTDVLAATAHALYHVTCVWGKFYHISVILDISLCIHFAIYDSMIKINQFLSKNSIRPCLRRSAVHCA